MRRFQKRGPTDELHAFTKCNETSLGLTTDSTALPTGTRQDSFHVYYSLTYSEDTSPVPPPPTRIYLFAITDIGMLKNVKKAQLSIHLTWTLGHTHPTELVLEVDIQRQAIILQRGRLWALVDASVALSVVLADLVMQVGVKVERTNHNEVVRRKNFPLTKQSDDVGPLQPPRHWLLQQCSSPLAPVKHQAQLLFLQRPGDAEIEHRLMLIISI